MGRSRSKERRDRDRDKKEKKEGKEKEKERKRSRSRDRRRDKEERKRSKSKERRRPPPEPEPPAPPPQQERQRSPSLQYRRWRFDSPPKDEEYQRDAMLTGNPMGIGGVAAALQGGLAGAGSTISPLALAADTKAMRELYVGNLPAGITAPQLVQFLNQVAIAVKVNTLPGEPVLAATLGGGGLFAFVEFRTAEESANGLRLNGVELLGCQLKIGRPKGYMGPDSAGSGLTMPGLQMPGQGLSGLQTGGSQLSLPGGSGGAPSLGEMMAQHGALRPGQLALPGLPGAPGSAMVSAIDHRLCLVNIPLFVTEERIRELLITFGQLKFFALQKDEDGKSSGVAFFEYQDMMTQQQARAALEGLELGAKKLSVKKPEEVLEMGLVKREQKLGKRVVPSRVLYLKNIVTIEDLADDSGYADICADIRLEGEKFGTIVSMEVPRPGGASGSAGSAPALTQGRALALEDTKADDGKGAGESKPEPAPAPDNSMALVPVGGSSGAPGALPGTLALHGTVVPGMAGSRGGAAKAAGSVNDDDAGVGFAFIEFATIEGSSKAKKALNGRRFGGNLVEAEFYSEDKYQSKDFAKPVPNTDEPKREPGSELVLFGTAADGTLATLDEAPVMVE